MPATVKLSQQLVTHDGPVSELTLRDLTARDLVEMRVAPISMSLTTEGVGAQSARSNKVEVRFDVVMGYLTRLTGIDEVLLGSLSSSDFNKCVAALTDLWNASGE